MEEQKKDILTHGIDISKEDAKTRKIFSYRTKTIYYQSKPNSWYRDYNKEKRYTINCPNCKRLVGSQYLEKHLTSNLCKNYDPDTKKYKQNELFNCDKCDKTILFSSLKTHQKTLYCKNFNNNNIEKNIEKNIEN